MAFRFSHLPEREGRLREKVGVWMKSWASAVWRPESERPQPPQGGEGGPQARGGAGQADLGQAATGQQGAQGPASAPAGEKI